MERMVQNNRQISIQMELLANRRMAEKSLTAVQAHVLRYILQHSEHGISLSKIQREFGYSKATLSHILKNLREKGYVRAECCAGDERCKNFFPSEKGEQVKTFLNDTIPEIHQQMYRCFSPKQLDTLDHLQQKMLKNLSELMKQTQKEASEL